MVRIGHVISSQFRSGQGRVRARPVRLCWDNVRSGQVNSGQIKLGQGKIKYGRSGLVISGLVRSNRFRSGQNHVMAGHDMAKSAQVKPGLDQDKVMSRSGQSQIRSDQVKSGHSGHISASQTRLVQVT